MTQAFPPIMSIGIDEPSRFEGEVFDLEVIEGEIPSELDGLFIQAVPEHQFPPHTPTISMMDASAGGDGLARAIRFKNGHADFLTRYVRTDRYVAERAARRSLFGHYRNPFSDDATVAGVDRTTANTAIYFHAGKLLASKEDGLPYEIDPANLQTLGKWTAGGAITSKTLTAHPKFDPKNGEMVAFGYAAKGECTRDIAYYVIDRDGKVIHEAWFEAPVAAMIHDCAATDNYTVFPIMPLTSDTERLKQGGLHFQFDPDMPQYFGVIPRYGRSEEVRWFEAPPGFPGHTVNAFQVDGKIVFDVLEANGNGFGPMFPDKDGNFPPMGSLTTKLVRWTIDYHANSLELTQREEIARVTGEGPHIDERFALRDYRYAWIPGLDATQVPRDQSGRPLPVMFNTLTRMDIATGETVQWFAGETATLQDPVYTPRSPDAPEGEGYLISIVNHVFEKRSEVVILDAANLPAGPIARIRIPVRLRTGIHATWIDGARLDADANN